MGIILLNWTFWEASAWIMPKNGMLKSHKLPIFDWFTTKKYTACSKLSFFREIVIHLFLKIHVSIIHVMLDMLSFSLLSCNIICYIETKLLTSNTMLNNLDNISSLKKCHLNILLRESCQPRIHLSCLVCKFLISHTMNQMMQNYIILPILIAYLCDNFIVSQKNLNII